MKIVLTGGGSGGHFYPLIAVTEELNKITREQNLLAPEIFFMSDKPYDKRLLFENDIIFKKVITGKLRRYFSVQNITDIFKTGWGIIAGFFTVFGIYPDIVFSKGGYTSFPAVLAARILRIPLIIHESDSVPGRANRWAGKFAGRIAVSYAEAAKFFPQGRTAWTGNPIRKEIQTPATGAHALLQFNRATPTILVLGGSQGALLINNVILEILPELLEEFQVIHQMGTANFKSVTEVISVILKDSPNKNRYRPFDYLAADSLRMAVGCADIIISRAGSTIFEIALWGKPSIIVPITDSHGDHQRENAVAYAKSGSCLVIEEANLKPHILISEVRRIINDSKLKKQMAESARRFAKPDAAEKIARAILGIALTHEQ
ncbi:MAG: hypothetical protein A3C06_04785 [Candidatus Taylorbacteria bacterium RIFCSPHIGHO2_02_FULL_46_13]|uniref:UDP-N-acetylglucosamine--N-acetylmuramyl-(pentapeptide) pyrophosphoryl-undecaprenol N-acetylglucosamine transferase n=1 Tax=Candidatus Taylorbacteria bacterium RIFCSPHIGHO2_02_FULL_46_13 TaxID=1802312 RepID=A0A1G2MR06_9BACT|nr:MAG: hypothetical protein A3C06_04785 [Candidatus Taylorbacteria bacterium RIFCSPHIGHO2_02_FULL_46_13]